MPSDYWEIITDDEAAAQLNDLINSDPRYADEISAYEWILSREAEKQSVRRGYGGATYYMFRTKPRKNGPPSLWVSYFIDQIEYEIDELNEDEAPEPERVIRVFDVRPAE